MTATWADPTTTWADTDWAWDGSSLVEEGTYATSVATFGGVRSAPALHPHAVSILEEE